LNLGNARAEDFHKQSDYQAFLEMMAEASLSVRMRVLAYCLMPDHVHLGLWPAHDGDLSRWMHSLLTFPRSFSEAPGTRAGNELARNDRTRSEFFLDCPNR
jgi:REP element-mobilizing transposase RayT